MKLDLTPKQVEALRGSIARTRLDMYAECENEWDLPPPSQREEWQTYTDYCKELRREDDALERILNKLNGQHP